MAQLLPAQTHTPSHLLSLGALSALLLAPGLSAQIDAFTAFAPESLGPHCQIVDDMAVVVNHAGDAEGLRAVLSRLPEPQRVERQFRTTTRWDSTAVDGALVGDGPFTLTYSFVPDGILVPGGVGEPDSGCNLFAQMNALFPGGESAWRAEFARAFDRWGELAGITFTEVADDGASFPDSPGLTGARGDIRVAMHFIDGGAGPNILAYNNFPLTGGDMVLDSGNVSGDFAVSDDGFRRLRNTVGHELGHGLGLLHTDPLNGTKLMESFIPFIVDGPREDDARGIQQLYGDPWEDNDTVATASSLGTLPPHGDISPVPLRLPRLSLDGGADVDVFSFDVIATAFIDVSVSPVGTLYAEGPQDGSIAPLPGREMLDLGFEILAPDGTTSIALVDESGLGELEIAQSVALPQGAGTHFVRVFSTSPGSELQRYALTFSMGSDVGPPFTPDDVLPLASGVAFLPEQPVAGGPLTILYDGPGGPLGGSPRLFLRQGINGFQQIPSPDGELLFDTFLGVWRLDFVIPPNAAVVDFAFRDEEFNFDNRFQNDFRINLSTANSPFSIDGVLDDEAQLLDSNAGRSLYAADRGGWLYVATEAQTPDFGGEDVFILVAGPAGPGSLVPAQFGKSGQVAAWDHFLGREGENFFNAWFDVGQSIVQEAGAFESAFVSESFMEGAINLETAFGTSDVGQVFLAVTEYQTSDGQPLTGQVPAAVVVDGNIQASEYFGYTLTGGVTAVGSFLVWR